MNDRIKILVLGATGLTGREVIRQAIASGMEVHAIVRSTDHGLPAGVKTFVTPLDQMDRFPEAFQVDCVICALGTTMKKAGSEAAFRKVDVEYPALAARTAASIGVPRFVLVSATGASPDSRFFYNRAKAEAEALVLGSGIPSVTILRPSLLMGDRTENRPGERLGILIMRVLGPLMIGPFRRMRGVTIPALAATALREASRHTQGSSFVESEFILP